MTRQKLLQQVRQVGGYLTEQLKALQEEHGQIREVRGLGLMLGLEMESADLAKTVVQRMLERGVLLNRTDETVVRFLPPFILAKRHVDVAVRELGRVLARTKESDQEKGAARETSLAGGRSRSRR